MRDDGWFWFMPLAGRSVYSKRGADDWMPPLPPPFSTNDGGGESDEEGDGGVAGVGIVKRRAVPRPRTWAAYVWGDCLGCDCSFLPCCSKRGRRRRGTSASSGGGGGADADIDLDGDGGDTGSFGSARLLGDRHDDSDPIGESMPLFASPASAALTAAAGSGRSVASVPVASYGGASFGGAAAAFARPLSNGVGSCGSTGGSSATGASGASSRPSVFAGELSLPNLRSKSSQDSPSGSSSSSMAAPQGAAALPLPPRTSPSSSV